jgi:hypothetical protein
MAGGATMTFGSMILMLSWAMGEALQGAVLLLGVLVCMSAMYLFLVHLSHVIRERMRGAGATGDGRA